MTRASRVGVWLAAVAIAACAAEDDAAPPVEREGAAPPGEVAPPPPAAAPAASEAPAPPAFPAPVPEGCVTDVSAGHHEYTCDGVRFVATIPAGCLTRACGLVFDVHGFSMSAEMQEANTRLAERAGPRGYIVVQPSASPAPPLAMWRPSQDDDKVFAMLERVARVFHVDERRVHFTGFSQGGAMTWRMLCKHAATFASVAPAAEGGCPFTPSDRPSREVPVLYLFGTKDAIVPFSAVAAPQRAAVVAGWHMGAGVAIASGAGFTRTRYASAAGTPFEMLAHEYEAPCTPKLGGHCFPGSRDPGTVAGQVCKFGCTPPSALDWGAEVLAFFEAHPKP